MIVARTPTGEDAPVLTAPVIFAMKSGPSALYRVDVSWKRWYASSRLTLSAA